MKRIVLLINVTVLLLLKGYAQPVNTARLDSLFTLLDANRQAMGSIAISKNKEIVYNRVFGYSIYNSDEKVPATEKTKYRIGSISKIFTATIIFQLIEENKLSLCSTLDEYFPQFPNSKMITIGNLLNHKSGIPDIKKVAAKKRARTHEQMLQIIADKKGWISPDSMSSYSNANFLLLGYIIEKICGQPYSEVLQNRILSKIGLTQTYFGDHQPRAPGNESFPYRLTADWKQVGLTDISIAGASGGIISTPSDMLRFIEALFSKKLVSDNSLNKMKTISGDYGMGMFEFELATKKAFGHPGGIDRFESVLAYFPEDSLAIAYCTNGLVYPVKNIVVTALNICFGNQYEMPVFKKIPVASSRLKKYEGIYSSSYIPLKIKISKIKKNLTAVIDGYPPYELQAVSKVKFRCNEASAVIEFDNSKKEMRLLLNGKNFNFTKQDQSRADIARKKSILLRN